MRNSSIKLLAAFGVVLALLAGSARAGLVVFEDFEGMSTANLHGQDGWSAFYNTGNVQVVSTDGGTNQAVRYSQHSSGDARGFWKALGTDFSIGSGTDLGQTATMSLRFMAAGSNLGDNSFGLTRSNPTERLQWDRYQVQLQTVNDNGDIRLRVRDGSTDSLVGDPLTANTWYTLRVNIFHADQKYDVWIEGGTQWAQPTKIASDIAFRNASSDNLVAFYATTNDVYVGSPAAVLIDDIQFIPEPTAWLLALIAAAFGLLARRRRGKE